MYKRGNSWYSDFWYKGKRHTKSHGPVSKTIAREKDRSFRADVAAGTYTEKRDDPIFNEAIKEYLKKSKVENAESSYKRNLLSSKFLKDHFGSKRIRQIEGNEVLVRQYVKKRKDEIKEKQIARGRTEEEVTYTSINRELALLRAMFNHLIKAGKATKNPVSFVTFFEEVQKERILTDDEENRIIAEIEKSDKRYRHLKDMVVVALNSGMRQGRFWL